MANVPVVSVLLPVYNGEPYLQEAVESILDQTFRAVEFIIIDDGSTDRSWRTLTRCATQDDRIVLVRNEENVGLVGTLNKGLAMARGEYIARQDQDDISLPERLATQVAYLECHTEVGLLGTAYYRLDVQGQRTLCRPPLTDTEIRWQLLFGSALCHPSVMFRRQLLDADEPFYREFVHAEDYELWTRLVERTRAANLPVPLVVYRVHDGRTCAVHREKQRRIVADISAQQINGLMHQHPFTSSEVEALHRCYYRKALTEEDMAVGRVIFEVFDAFEQQSGVDRAIVSTIRRRWIKRLLATTLAEQWHDLWTSGLMASILRHDPMSVPMIGLTYLPKRIAKAIQQLRL